MQNKGQTNKEYRIMGKKSRIKDKQIRIENNGIKS